MAILVTGGAGYIGSHTLVELLHAHYDVVIVDNFSNSQPECLDRVRKITGKDFRLYEMDLRNRAGLDQVFSENKIDAVLHFSGLKSVGESIQTPMRYYQNNLAGTLTLCEVMEKHNVKKLIFSSSATVYGKPEQVPISEDSLLYAINPYGRTKLMIEEMLGDLHAADHEWRMIILRYFNPIGAHVSGEIGENPSGVPNNLMPFITKVAIGELKELKIFGNCYSTVDGTGVRDYIHVVDLAQGHLKALEKILNMTGMATYNLGTGKGYTVLEVVEAFEKASGRQIPYRIAKPRQGDAASCYADPLKSEQELGWKAKKGLNEMCEDSWRWQKMNPTGYKRKNKITAVSDNPRLSKSRDFLIL